MSKQSGPGKIAGLAVVVLQILALAGAGIPARLTVAQQAIGQEQQERRTPAATAAASKTAAVEAATAAVLQETSEIRGLSILRPVRSGAQSRSEIERMIIKNMDEESTPEEMHASEITMKKMGLAPADFTLRDFMIKLLTEQVAGYYDPKAQRFYLADWIDLDGQRPVMAHELTHALQDQHFNLARPDKWPKGDSDAELAAHALVEGDATLVMSMYISRNPMRALAFMRSMGGNSESKVIDSAPRALREALLFPYEQGLAWVTQVYRRQGWAGVSQAFSDLPKSTKQILHPDKYFSREVPLAISQPNIHTRLGANWKRVDYDVNGEWGHYLILDEFLKSSDESKRAAAGWRGDRYAVYENGKSGEVAITQLSAWESDQAAQDFFDAYVKRTGRRYAGSRISEAPAPGAARSRFWHTDQGDVWIERRDSRVMVLEGIPATVNAADLADRLWRQ